MRIFHVITLSSVGGAQSVVVNLANRQVLDNEVYVISSADGEAWKALDPRVRTIGIKQLHREISWRDAFVLLRLIWCRLRLRPTSYTSTPPRSGPWDASLSHRAKRSTRCTASTRSAWRTANSSGSKNASSGVAAPLSA